MARALDEHAAATLVDLCEHPGLFAGQYDAIEAIAAKGLVHTTYHGAAGFMGLGISRPSDFGLCVYEALMSL